MKKEVRAVPAVMAAVGGTAFASGREIALFFSQFGKASWIAVWTAAVVFGALCGGLCKWSERMQMCGFRGVLWSAPASCMLRTGIVLYIALQGFTAALMLRTVGHMAALSLNMKNAFCMGAAGAMSAALMLNRKCGAGMTAAGCLVLACSSVYFAALLLDGRKTELFGKCEVIPKLAGCIPAAVLAATMHAALNVCTAAWMVVGASEKVGNPVLFGMACSAAMLIQLSLVNAAVLRGGEELLVQAYPTVLLAARWGKAGFFTAVAHCFLCCTATLAAAVGNLFMVFRNCVKL